MSQAVTVARLTLRELWMTFRLLVVLVVFVGISAFAVLLPAAPSVILDRLATGLVVATVMSAGVAAWTIADERRSDRAGWIVTRSVSRQAYLHGVFAGLTVVAVAGVAASVLLGWSTTFSLPVPVDPPSILAVMLAVATTVSISIAVGLVAGALLPRLPAAMAAIVLVAGMAAAGPIAGWSPGWLRPDAAFLLVAGLMESNTVPFDAIRVAGLGLVGAAMVLLLAGAAIERAEL